MCCQVEVSALGQSLVQSSPIECVCVCVCVSFSVIGCKNIALHLQEQAKEVGLRQRERMSELESRADSVIRNDHQKKT